MTPTQSNSVGGGDQSGAGERVGRGLTLSHSRVGYENWTMIACVYSSTWRNPIEDISIGFLGPEKSRFFFLRTKLTHKVAIISYYSNIARPIIIQNITFVCSYLKLNYTISSELRFIWAWEISWFDNFLFLRFFWRIANIVKIKCQNHSNPGYVDVKIRRSIDCLYIFYTNIIFFLLEKTQSVYFIH